MCTVTYTPPTQRNAFMLTSNRDEKEFWPTLPPDIYWYGDSKLVFPKDEIAGGSWIAINDKRNINCLLNGGFIPHQKQEHHTKSRGTVLLDFTRSALTAHAYFSQTELHNVEPFTIVALTYNEDIVQDITEFVWDGNDKHFRQIDIYTPHIWSSVTLYTEEQRKTKKEWFERFYKQYKDVITNESIVDFHSGYHINNHPGNIIIERDGGLKTVSISQVSFLNGKLQMDYYDLLHHSVKEVEL